MIVKHENRIRALEEKAKATEEEEGRVGDGLRVARQTAPPLAPANDTYEQDLAPDEV